MREKLVKHGSQSLLFDSKEPHSRACKARPFVHLRVRPLEKEEGADDCFLVLDLPLNNWVLLSKPASSPSLHLLICAITRLGPMFLRFLPAWVVWVATCGQCLSGDSVILCDSPWTLASVNSWLEDRIP